jgi:hypothetical protein
MKSLGYKLSFVANNPSTKQLVFTHICSASFELLGTPVSVPTCTSFQAHSNQLLSGPNYLILFEADPIKIAGHHILLTGLNQIITKWLIRKQKRIQKEGSEYR